MPTLYVTATSRCVDLLEFIKKNIKEINNSGGRIDIKKVGQKDIKQLQAIGVRSTPAMILGGAAPGGRSPAPIIGAEKIIKVIKMRLRGGMGPSAATRSDGELTAYDMPQSQYEFGGDPSISDYYAKELYSGKNKRGEPIPRKDNDEDDSENIERDMQRRMMEYQTKVPKHRRQQKDEDSDDEDDRDPMPMPAPRGRSGGTRRHSQPSRRRPSRTDNINNDSDDDSDDDGGATIVSGQGIAAPATDNELDDKMMAAWLDNN